MAGKQERQRRLARERYERRMVREAERQRRTKKTTQFTALGLIFLAVIGVVIYLSVGLGGNKPSAAANSSPSHTPSSTPSPTPTPTGPPWKPSTAAWAEKPSGTAIRCAYTPGGTASRNAGIPPLNVYTKDSYRATIRTNRGTIVIALRNNSAPCTVNSLAYLATKGYFNNTPCHRLTTSPYPYYVLQCGAPTGSSYDSPGYAFASENLVGATYPAGTVAMANSGQPNTNGSQFFMVYKNTSLPPQYTPFGTIVSGLNILQNIAKAGTDNGSGDGHPKESVQILSVTINKA